MTGLEALNELETKLHTAAADERKRAANWTAEGVPDIAAAFFTRAEGIDEALEILTVMRDRLTAGGAQ